MMFNPHVQASVLYRMTPSELAKSRDLFDHRAKLFQALSVPCWFVIVGGLLTASPLVMLSAVAAAAVLKAPYLLNRSRKFDCANELRLRDAGGIDPSYSYREAPRPSPSRPLGKKFHAVTLAAKEKAPHDVDCSAAATALQHTLTVRRPLSLKAAGPQTLTAAA